MSPEQSLPVASSFIDSTLLFRCRLLVKLIGIGRCESTRSKAAADQKDLV
jgi:hypothetical protein